jgi:uncharacterized Fe-S cluster-containing radical SAM superfamily protein
MLLTPNFLFGFNEDFLYLYVSRSNTSQRVSLKVVHKKSWSN